VSTISCSPVPANELLARAARQTVQFVPVTDHRPTPRKRGCKVRTGLVGFSSLWRTSRQSHRSRTLPCASTNKRQQQSTARKAKPNLRTPR
jgi:hypothetical protein